MPKSKKVVLQQVFNYLLVSLGTFLLAFGSVIFLAKCDLVAGGISGISIIVQNIVYQCGGTAYIYDYVAAALTIFFWLIGLIFIGKDFALKTLLSSILYIGFTFLFARVEFFNHLALESAGIAVEGDPISTGNYILCAMFAGVFIGGGVALTFLGGGSTGGVDCLQILLEKHLNIKESISSLIIDIVVIGVGMLVMRLWIPALCGILTCVVTALLIEIIYIKNLTSYQVDIISTKWKEISNYAQDVLERGATIIHAEGGYKGEERVILRIVFPKYQYEKIRNFIAEVDPTAFVTFTQTRAVYGEGFKHNKSLKIDEKKNKNGK